MRGRRLALASLAAALAISGCFSEILPESPISTLAFACAAIDPATAPRFRVVSAVEDGVEVGQEGAVSALLAEVGRLSGRGSGDLVAAWRDAPAPQGGPEAAWDGEALADWARGEPFLTRSVVSLHVLWVRSLEDPLRTGDVPAPGAVALSASALELAASRVGRPVEEVARVVLLHQAGHAFGAVNRGIPVQDPAIQERERPAGHDADPGSVLAAGWDDARSMAWAANATYAGYPDAALADWAAARGPGGVCP